MKLTKTECTEPQRQMGTPNGRIDATRHAGREHYKGTDRIEARMLAWTTRHKPTDGSAHWSLRKIHVIADNLSAHKARHVDAFLAAHGNVHLHFTPTRSSWLNQVELWFAKIERDVIARGVFTSVPDLKRKPLRYARQYNKQSKTVKWKYFDPSRRITPESIATVH